LMHISKNLLKGLYITGIKITLHTLRSVFADRLSSAKIPDAISTLFCGRVEKTELARHYRLYL
ncbi:MAG: hypothetical protein QW372_02980, partial [Nitrososphaerales archaeon]